MALGRKKKEEEQEEEASSGDVFCMKCKKKITNGVANHQTPCWCGSHNHAPCQHVET